MLDYLRRLFAYDDWANREVLSSLRTAPNPPPQSLKLIAHILSAEGLWLARLKQQKPALSVWPELVLAQCKAEADMLGPHGGLTSRNADRPVCRVRSAM